MILVKRTQEALVDIRVPERRKQRERSSLRLRPFTILERRRDVYTCQSVPNQQLVFRLIFQLINVKVAVQMHIANKGIVYANLALLVMATNANVSTFIFSLSCALYQ